MHTPPILATVAQAKRAIEMDNLATVYFRAGGVFVATAHGTGTFTRQEWDAAAAPRPSVQTTPNPPPRLRRV